MREFLLMLINAESITICPVDETGKNSVTPSIMASMNTSK